jgi:hypothetical protein
MTTQALNLYEVLKVNLNDTGVRAVVQYIEEYMEVMVSKHVDTKIAHLATKEDLVILDGKIVALKDDLNQLDIKLVKMIVDTRAELVKMIMDTKADLMKWMFIFISGQTVIVAGLLKLFL